MRKPGAIRWKYREPEGKVFIADGRNTYLFTPEDRQVLVRALVTDRVHSKQLYMPMNSTESPVNRLTGSQSDAATHTPAYKEVAVSLQVLPEVDESPLPRNNHRFGHPTPQLGVQVERKWNRADYSVPGNGNGNALVQVQIRRKQE